MSNVIPFKDTDLTPFERAVQSARFVVGYHLALQPYDFITEAGDRLSGGPLRPRQVVQAWKQGLNDAGYEVKTAQAHIGGGKFKTLSLVLQFDCPFDHEDADGEGWAKLRLKVNPHTGWVRIHKDSCTHCLKSQIEDWLITCPRCAAGVDHPSHGLFSGGDESPVAYVDEAMRQFRRGGELVADSPKAPTTVAATVEWLAALMSDDGSPLVPPTMGQNAAWAVVKHLPGCPTQELVRQAQAQRKAGTG